MTHLLHEVLLSAVGIRSDLSAAATGARFSRADFALLPPGAGSLIAQISSAGDAYQALAAVAEGGGGSPYGAALCESLDSFLDRYRDAILAAECDIDSGQLASLTGLVARVEPHRRELEFVQRVVESALRAPPLAMLNVVHAQLSVSPPSVVGCVRGFEAGLQRVVINQVNGYVFYHQRLPEIFEVTEENGITYSGGAGVSFLPKQFADVLLFVVRAVAMCDNVFGDVEPPNCNSLTKYIEEMSGVVSEALSVKLDEQWPAFSRDLYSLFLVGRSDYISIMARKLIQKNISSYDLNLTLSSLYNNNAEIELVGDNVVLKSEIKQPLNLIVTEEHQRILSNIFNLLMKLYITEEYLNESWVESKKRLRVFKFYTLVRKLFEEIKGYIIFTVISPSTYLLQKITKDIKDFLKFQTIFSVFIMKLQKLLPIMNDEFLKSMINLFDNIYEYYNLIVNESLLSNESIVEIFQAIENIATNITESSIKIGSLLNFKKDDPGITLTQNISKLSKCILNFFK